jgi:hypothetical protein
MKLEKDADRQKRKHFQGNYRLTCCANLSYNIFLICFNIFLIIAPSDMELLSSMATRLSQTEQQLRVSTREVIEKVVK